MAAVAAGADAGAGTPPPLSPSPDGGHIAQGSVFGSAFTHQDIVVAEGGDVADHNAQDHADLQHYASLLGVNWEQDADLLWVVEEAFHAPLPESWTEHTDEEGRCYFFHEVEGQSTWEHPTDAVYRELVRVIHCARAEYPPAAVAQQAAYIHDHLRQVHQRAMDALEGWSGPYASEVGDYYYNEKKKASTWHCPVAEWEHELQIRHAVLCRCLLPEQTVVAADGSIAAAGGEGSLAGVVGANLLQTLQLPLNLVRRDGTDQPEQPEDTPSTTRSYFTARSVASTRSQQLSGRSGDKFARAADKVKSPQGSSASMRSPHSIPTRPTQAPPYRLGHQEEMREDVEAEANHTAVIRPHASHNLAAGSGGS